MCLLRSRVRSPSSAGWAPCRERPGRSGGGGTSGSLSRQERERVPGVKRSRRCDSHRVSAGPMTAPTRFRTGVLGEGFDSYTLTSTVVKRAVGEGASPALPCGIGLGSATTCRSSGDDSRPRSEGLPSTRSRRAGLTKANGNRLRTRRRRPILERLQARWHATRRRRSPRRRFQRSTVLVLAVRPFA